MDKKGFYAYILKETGIHMIHALIVFGLILLGAYLAFEWIEDGWKGHLWEIEELKQDIRSLRKRTEEKSDE